MSVSKLTDRTELAATPANGDLLHVVDIDDTTGSPEWTSKKITVQNLLAAASGGGGASTITVRNTTGSTITAGSAVHLNGAVSSTPTVELADNATAMPAIGIVGADIANNADGTCTIMGEVLNLDTSGFAVGDIIYVGTSGVLVNTKPTGSAQIQNLGQVEKVSASTGSILLLGAGRTNDVPNLPSRNVFIGDATNTATTRTMTSNDLDDMAPGTTPTAGYIFQHDGVSEFRGVARVLSGNTDVSTSTPSNGDTLTYNSTSGLWEPAAGGGGGGTNYFSQNFAFFDNNVRNVYLPWSSETEGTSVQRYNRWIVPVDLTVVSVSIWFGYTMSGGTGGSVELILQTGGSTVTVKDTVTFSSTSSSSVQTFTFTTNNTFTQNQVMMIRLNNGFGSSYGNIIGNVLFST